jgi:3-oxoacyl-[acyl-carrier protein] reductase
MSSLLENKNIFLTGGSRGLGQATVLELVKHGANVAFTYLRNEEGARATVQKAKEIDQSRKVIYYRLDVRSSKEVDQVADRVIAEMGRIDVVVNNSGNLKDGLIYSMSDEDWQDVIQVHLTGTFYVCRAFLEEFMVNKGGKFINIASLSFKGSVGQANYSAAKAGVIGFSKTLAKEYGQKNIYCNVVIPGYFETDLTKENAADFIVENAKKRSSLKRIGEPNELGKVVVFCASDLSSYVNGSVIYATGGIEDFGPIQ